MNKKDIKGAPRYPQYPDFYVTHESEFEITFSTMIGEHTLRHTQNSKIARERVIGGYEGLVRMVEKFKKEEL